MKKMAILLLVLVSTSVLSQGNSGYLSIANNKLQIISGGSPRIYVYNVPISNSGCNGATSSPVLLMDSSVALHKEMYAMLLAAKTSGKKVNIITDGCWNNGEYPKIYSIYMTE